MLNIANCVTILFNLLFLLICIIGSNCFLNDCKAMKDRGYRCENDTKPNVMFYFDNETEQCLPFLYEGCGGSENRFSNIETCRLNCIPQDYGWCAMKGKAYEDNESSTVICSGPLSDPCPEKYVCRHLAFFGICCPAKTEEMFAKNFNPSCTKGKLVKLNSDGFSIALLGKNCSDNFCPENSECFQQEIFAYCCN
ncbi:Kunitz/Bovine pancreatic trypsin inhibitor domain family protein [Acanthocheilonema viteae]